jgi:hypothetical protein
VDLDPSSDPTPSPDPTPPDPTPDAELTSADGQLAAELARVVAALRTTPRFRLRAACEGRYPTRVAAGRALAAALATAAQGIEDADVFPMPTWRSLPALPDLAVGDQVAVLAHDYLDALATAPAEAWRASGRVPIEQLRAEITEVVADVGALWAASDR